MHSNAVTKGWITVRPGALGQHPPNPSIAGLGNAATANATARRPLAGHQAEAGHQSSGILEPLDVADVHHEGDSVNQPDATQGLKALHHRCEWPVDQGVFDRSLKPRSLLERGFASRRRSSRAARLSGQASRN